MTDLQQGDRAVRKDVGDAGHIYRVHDEPQELTGARLCDFWSDTLGLQNGVNMGVLEAEATTEHKRKFDSLTDAAISFPSTYAKALGGDEVKQTPAQAKPAPSRSIAHKGGGYYDLLEDDTDVGTIRGKALAKAWLEGWARSSQH